MSADPLLALVQLIRGAEALADGRHVAADEELRRIFDPAEIPYHPVVRFWAMSHLVEAAVACGRSEDLTELIDEVASAGPFPVLQVALNYRVVECRPLLRAATEALGAPPWADGLSNREIGARLFLSPRMISTHLYRIFPKLGVTGRAELSRVLHPANYVS